MSLFDDVPDPAGGPVSSARAVRSPKRRKRQPAAAVQLSLLDQVIDFDVPTTVVEVDPGGTPLPATPGEHVEQQAATDFVPPATVTVPSSPRQRAEANLAALEVLRRIEAERRPATADEQRVLAGWSSWGAVPKVFEDDPVFEAIRGRLAELLDETELAAARATVLNAHYTDPLVVRQVWRALGELGFAGGRVLEPGCGSGNFVGHAPPGAELLGVELDPVTARIASLLYPSATIRAEGFEQTRLPEGSFVAAVGNVPFGGFKVFDPAFNRSGHNIHDHFIVKALRLTAPGGMVAVVTSAGTLDKRNPAARREMHRFGDLVGAVRLPSGAMARVAGTQVVCDVVVLRRRRDDETPAPAAAWETAVEVGTDTGPVRVNRWFADRPEMVLGELERGRGLYRADEMRVRADGRDLDEALGRALDAVVGSARDRGLTFDATATDTITVNEAPVSIARAEGPGEGRDPKPGTIRAAEGGGFARFDVGLGWVEHAIPASQTGELRELIALRDVALNLITQQKTGEAEPAVQAGRDRLNKLYDTYLERHGPINRYKTTHTASGRVVKRRPPFGGMRKHDPDFQVVAALELFDEDTQQAMKAPIFTVDVVRDRDTVRGADTAADAVAITVAETGRVDLGRVADLLGITADEAIAEVQDAQAAFVDPASDALVPAARYLSGDVRSKLDLARERCDADPQRWAGNVAALERVQPPDLAPDEIHVKPGVTWIEGADYADFVAETFRVRRDQVRVSYSRELGAWHVDVPRWLCGSPAMTTTWGTDRRHAVELLAASMNNTPVEVHYTTPDGVRVRDVKATLAALEKKSAIEKAFTAWVWTDPERGRRLGGVYNRRFNSRVAPTYDGAALSLPGLGETFRPRAHQRDAVARIVNEPAVLLDHVVGAGKTGTMIMAGMELRRLGLARQPWYVVPNHLVEQFSREFKQWYPGADLLVGATGMDPVARRAFAAASAVTDVDAVVVPQSVFKQIPVSARTEAAHLATELDAIEKAKRVAAESASTGGRDVRVKELEKALAKGRAKLAQLRAGSGRDLGVSFEETGCDYLFIDEAHHFKNKRVASGTREFDNTATPSQQAEDLAVKLHVLRERNPRTVATFATATPVANSLREMFVMQTFLRPDLLAAAEVDVFDTWAATFTRSVTALETDVTGTGYRMHTRVSAFVNTPELVALTRQFSDVVTRDTLGVPLPAVVGGGRRAVITRPSAEVIAYQKRLDKRAELVRARVVDPRDDNMLKIVNDGRKAALDPRLVGLPADPGGGRIADVADAIIRIHRATAERVYTDAFGQPHPRPGGLQFVFCDRSTPSKDWNVYDALRDELAAAGMDPKRVRFAHEARNDAERAELFEACRDGRVNVLIGSTEKMGTGVNAQRRAVALHHVDCPWRPADLEQREGRPLRQGNQNSEVEILGYATEGSLDTYMWQTVERKQRFIAQLRTGGHLARSVEDIGDSDAMSYAEFKAASSGNPLIMQREQLAADVSRLATLQHAHHDTQRRIAFDATRAHAAATDAARQAAALRAALPRRLDTTGEAFTMTIEHRHYNQRVDAAAAITQLVADAERQASNGHDVDTIVGHLGGFDLRIEANRRIGKVTIDVVDVPTAGAYIDSTDLDGATPGLGLIRRLEGQIARIDTDLETATDDHQRHATRAAELDALRGTPFEHTTELAEAKQRLTEIDTSLNSLDQPPGPATPSQDPAPPSTARMAPQPPPAPVVEPTI